ncbi:MAG: hypothetical protein C4576_03305 [Desulfobacteraceae bacterium]|nr:MAG: hypothetical protein C4576_03305 [Desulfobacteraceae bacterium]
MNNKIIKLKGVTFGDAQRNIKTFGSKDIGSFALVREPRNPHDPSAIRVELVRHYFLGYVPRAHAKELAPLIDSGRNFLAFFVSTNKHPRYDTVGMTVRIEEVPISAAA